jgi:hypothetical protein
VLGYKEAVHKGFLGQWGLSHRVRSAFGCGRYTNPNLTTIQHVTTQPQPNAKKLVWVVVGLGLGSYVTRPNPDLTTTYLLLYP